MKVLALNIISFFKGKFEVFLWMQSFFVFFLLLACKGLWKVISEMCSCLHWNGLLSMEMCPINKTEFLMRHFRLHGRFVWFTPVRWPQQAHFTVQWKKKCKKLIHDKVVSASYSMDSSNFDRVKRQSKKLVNIVWCEFWGKFLEKVFRKFLESGPTKLIPLQEQNMSWASGGIRKYLCFILCDFLLYQQKGAFVLKNG